jgi:predicted  nucleic acid-binding Zn-ribbon protein
MTEAEVRQVPTAEDLVMHVREAVTAIVRDALNEAGRLREEADEKLARFDAINSELSALKLERHSLRHDLAEIPARLHLSRLDALVDDTVGEDPDSLQSRYVVVRERLPVAESRIVRLENELSHLCAGGSRPAKVRNDRHLLKHNGREPALDALNDAAKAVEDLCESLPDVVTKAASDLLRERKRVRDGQAQLWGQSKA